MKNSDLLKEIQALREGQERLLALVAPRLAAEPVDRVEPLAPDIGVDLGKIYRTQGRTAFIEALHEQNRLRRESYRKRGIRV